MAISERFIDELIARTDIVDVVSRYVKLPKRSGNNFVGLCPFHSEKTPSFMVSSDKQIYHCFGCGKGGGPINFIMEIENHSFPDTIEYLARLVGMTVPQDSFHDSSADKRKRLLELNKEAARHFHSMLSTQSAQPALKYLAKRGVSRAMVKRFGLGVAVKSWDNLINAMKAKGYSQKELIDAGLARSKEKNDGCYDYFRDRLMFPVIDVRGNVIAFSGRSLGDDEPKYINTPDTLVFNKRHNLFALNIAKKTKAGMLILVEGNIDVIALHQAGFDSAVASLGTALTSDQVRLMSRYTDKVVIAYDSDEAGKTATSKAIVLLEKAGLEIKVLKMGESKDPDDFLKKHGADGFSILLDRSDNQIEYRLGTLTNRSDLNSDNGRINFISDATEILAELQTKAMREIYGVRVADMAGVSYAAIENEVEKAYKRRQAKSKRTFEREATNPKKSLQPESKELRYYNEYSAAAEEGVVRSLLNEPAIISKVRTLELTSSEFSSPYLAKLFELITQRIDEGREIGLSYIMASLNQEEASQLAVIMQKPEAKSDFDNIIVDYIEKLRAEKYKGAVPDRNLLLEIKKFKEKKSIGSKRN